MAHMLKMSSPLSFKPAWTSARCSQASTPSTMCILSDSYSLHVCTLEPSEDLKEELWRAKTKS